MGATGFDTKFYIRRKRVQNALQFLAYLDGKLSESAHWVDKEDTDVDATVTGAQLAPYGYITDGADYLTDNLGVNGVTITEFTIGIVFVRDEATNNEGIVYGLFGSTHYPRIYCEGTVMKAEIKLDGSVKTITVNGIDDYILNGKPCFVVFRGSITHGIELLIDGVSRGTQTDTGASFNTGNGGFYIGKDNNLSYLSRGAIRGVFACAQRMSDTLLSTWRTMLEYEGYFDLWNDNFAKWSGEEDVTSGAPQISSSPYVVTIVE